MTRASGAAGLPTTRAIPPPVAEHRDLGVLRPGRPAHWGRFFPSPRGKLFMLSLLNNSFNSRPRLGIPLLGQGKLAFDQQGQDDSDPLAEHADQPIPSGAFRASLVNVGGRQMRHGLLGPLVVVALPAPCSIHIRRAYQAVAAAWGGRSVRIYQPSSYKTRACPRMRGTPCTGARRAPVHGNLIERSTWNPRDSWNVPGPGSLAI